MSHIDELIESANRLCETLDKIANNDKNIHTTVGQILENMSHDVYSMASTIRELGYRYGL